MISGVNVNAGGGLAGVLTIISEHYSIPPSNVEIGGVTYSRSMIPIVPIRDLIVAGITGGAGTQVAEASDSPVEISVVPQFGLEADTPAFDVKDAYERLRRQMISEGLPFLNASELEREIADRKGSRY